MYYTQYIFMNTRYIFYLTWYILHDMQCLFCYILWLFNNMQCKLCRYSRITIIWCANNVICNTDNIICSSNDMICSQCFETCRCISILNRSFTFICGAFFITMIRLFALPRNNFRKFLNMTAHFKALIV